MENKPNALDPKVFSRDDHKLKRGFAPGLSGKQPEDAGMRGVGRYFEMDIESHATQIEEFVEGGNYHAALNIALSGLNECRRDEDQHGVDTFLGIIAGITKTLAEEFGSQEYLDRRGDG